MPNQDEYQTAIASGIAAVTSSPQAERTTITLGISREDKTRFKAWAAAHGVTMSDVLHDWIIGTCRD